ncbi:LysE family translocator [Paenibacillus sp. NEAU-GSW1]|uniref:LysE family translocator n=1 Tax=Paenibacillus sp. NEAU-GSW1 TaxID=2682486 RepID=UPI0012E1BB07|nr:LysE family transporter [Paenibacillus sp. NEAU-GSW1]MUT67389.1 LysE family translocator [Paenibacillus sp. NEAU-GSW1]
MTVFNGLLIGLSIAAPVGPIGILCMKRMITQGRLYGLASGFGAAAADAVYGIIAAAGFTAVMDLLTSQQQWIRLLGGLFLIYLGLQSFLAQAADERGDVKSSRSLAHASLTTFALTISNPLTIISFVGIFSAIEQTSTTGAGGAWWMMIGIWLGSMLWWTFLCIVIGSIRTVLNRSAMRWINLISGVVLLTYGAIAIIKAISG